MFFTILVITSRPSDTNVEKQRHKCINQDKEKNLFGKLNLQYAYSFLRVSDSFIACMFLCRFHDINMFQFSFLMLSCSINSISVYNTFHANRYTYLVFKY